MHSVVEGRDHVLTVEAIPFLALHRPEAGGVRVQVLQRRIYRIIDVYIFRIRREEVLQRPNVIKVVITQQQRMLERPRHDFSLQIDVGREFLLVIARKIKHRGGHDTGRRIESIGSGNIRRSEHRIRIAQAIG